MGEKTAPDFEARPRPPETDKRLRKTAAIFSCVLWTAGFFLAFVIAPGSPLIWVPDGLLLAGFIPLLLVWKPAWPWFVFGFFNIVIGFVLLVAQFLPDTNLPAEMPKVRQHLAEFHVPLEWMFFGVVFLVYGLVRLVKNFIRRLSGRGAADSR